MATEYVTGTPENDLDLNGGDGVNEYDGGPGDDVINGADGENTIIYEVGDGTDSITFAAPRPYQFAGYLDAATAALDHDFGGEPAPPTATTISPPPIPACSAGCRSASRRCSTACKEATPARHGEWMPGSVDSDSAETAFEALMDWINAPVTNVIKFGPGISLSDLTVQMGQPPTSFDVPSTFVVAVGGKRGDGVQHAAPRCGRRCGSASAARRHRVRVPGRRRHHHRHVGGRARPRQRRGSRLPVRQRGRRDAGGQPGRRPDLCQRRRRPYRRPRRRRRCLWRHGQRRPLRRRRERTSFSATRATT